MINWLKKAQKPAATNINSENEGFFSKFTRGLSKTRHQIGDRILNLLVGKKTIDANLLEELESILVSADVGIATARNFFESLQTKLSRDQRLDGEQVLVALKQQLLACFTVSSPLILEADNAIVPFVILVVGVNGAGKTTLIGKLAKQYQQAGKKVMLAAGDTFRAAAVEQLEAWGMQNNVPVIAQHTGADSASVIFDAFQAAKARGIDVLIADTAGRLHTQHNLMDELKKIKRVLQKIDPKAPHEIMLVLDASIGQNALNQARQFNEAIGITGISMTKLDGTAKGGIVFAISQELKLPVRYLGVGEGIDDVHQFEAQTFVDALFSD